MMKIRYLLGALLVALGLAWGGAIAAPAAASQADRPAITIDPARGTDLTAVMVQGTRFTPGQRYILLQGIPQPFGEPLTSVEADAGGNWTARIVIDGYTPSGDPITTTNMRIVVVDENYQEIVGAPFAFTPVVAPPGMPTTGAAAPGGLLAALLGAALLMSAGLLLRRRTAGT
jgi:hypothetical protein